MLTRKMIIGMFISFVVLMNAICWGTTYYVDPSGSDDANGLLWEDAFATIQKGVDTAVNGDTVDVNVGTYYETVDFNGVACTVTSINPYDSDVVDATIIDANGGSYGVHFHNYEDANSILTGFTIQNANFGIYCLPASPTITYCNMKNNESGGIACCFSNSIVEYCIIESTSNVGMWIQGNVGVPYNTTIRYNIIRDSNNDGMYIRGQSATVKNNWIYDNGRFGAIIWDSNSTVLRNNTIVGNTAAGVYVVGTEPNISNCILWDNGDDLYGFGDLYNCTATYSCIEDCNDANGIGNICGDANDPMFVDPNNDDYHLDPNSPCFNAGDPNYEPEDGETDIDDQPRVMVTEVDMGADEAAYLPTCHPDYNEWVSFGKPSCWCYQRQCRGDSDGLKYSDPNGWFYVGQPDLDLLILAWKVKEPPHGPGIGSVENGICADFDHQQEGDPRGGYFRVGAGDLGILLEYWKILEPPDGNGIDPNCLECE